MIHVQTKLEKKNWPLDHWISPSRIPRIPIVTLSPAHSLMCKIWLAPKIKRAHLLNMIQVHTKFEVKQHSIIELPRHISCIQMVAYTHRLDCVGTFVNTGNQKLVNKDELQTWYIRCPVSIMSRRCLLFSRKAKANEVIGVFKSWKLFQQIKIPQKMTVAGTSRLKGSSSWWVNYVCCCSWRSKVTCGQDKS